MIFSGYFIGDVAWTLNIHRRVPDMKRKAMLGEHCLGLDERVSLLVWTEEIIAIARIYLGTT